MSLGPFQGRPLARPPLEPPTLRPGWNGESRPGSLFDTRRPQRKIGLHLFLFLLTVASTSLIVGPLYSLCVMTILTAHEFGHFFAARYHRVPASLPYFLPFPLPPLATLGAVIRMSPYIPNRRALFDIAAAGPIAGLVVALPVCVIGITTSEWKAPPKDVEFISYSLGDTILFQGLEYLIFGARPEGMELYLNGVAFAGWVGLFVTALNLLPIGQLDGGHICYGLFGRRSRLVAGVAFLVLAGLTIFVSPSYVLLLLLLWVFGIRHPPTLNDYIPLGPKRRAIGWALAVVFILCFSPTPITPILPGE